MPEVTRLGNKYSKPVCLSLKLGLLPGGRFRAEAILRDGTDLDMMEKCQLKAVPWTMLVLLGHPPLGLSSPTKPEEVSQEAATSVSSVPLEKGAGFSSGSPWVSLPDSHPGLICPVFREPDVMQGSEP